MTNAWDPQDNEKPTQSSSCAARFSSDAGSIFPDLHFYSFYLLVTTWGEFRSVISWRREELRRQDRHKLGLLQQSRIKIHVSQHPRLSSLSFDILFLFSVKYTDNLFSQGRQRKTELQDKAWLHKSNRSWQWMLMKFCSLHVNKNAQLSIASCP